MDKNLKAHIEYLLCVDIQSIAKVSGGDISPAFLLETETERFFCKINHGENAHAMFQLEKRGLEAIAETKTIAVPKVLICETLEQGGLLLMEYIEPKRASPEQSALFGHQLAALHSNIILLGHTAAGRSAETATFGWETDNFIGSLPQSNIEHTDWSKFYVLERLLPQLKLARQDNRLEANKIPSEERFLKTCENLFPEVVPSLLHGDLWSGNYLISSEGTPYLIDPAPYYGHHEIDIAMTRLFGGFGESFYASYKEHLPNIGGEAERTEIYQLYYLLVHLNLFGGSYKASVMNILNRYF